MSMTIEDLKLFCKRQGAAHSADMVKALGLRPLEYERWMKGEDLYDNDTILMLVDWARGRYGFSQVTGKWERDAPRSADPLKLQVKAAVAPGNPARFVAGTSVTHGGLIAGRGAPKGTSSAELKRIKEAEEAEVQRRQSLAAKVKQAFKPAPVMSLQESMARRGRA